MPHCQCGAFVSHDWKRVVGVNDDVTGCPQCKPINESGDCHGTHKLSVR